MKTPPVYVGVDLGTSSLKIIALDANGEICGEARSAYPTFRPSPGAAEQEPANWFVAIHAALSTLSRHVPASAWRGIGLTAMMPTLVMLDSVRRPIGHAITWQDERAAKYGDAMRARIAEGDLYAATGQWVDGRYLLPMAAAVHDRDPHATASATIAGAKDFLFAELTGNLVTDPSTAAGFGCFDLAARQWIEHLVDGWTLPAVAPAETTRPITDVAAEDLGIPAGLPVVLGAADSVLGADAAGATALSEVAYLTGSSTIMVRRMQVPVRDEWHRYLVTPMADNAVAAEMDLLATGSSVAWMSALLARGNEALQTTGAQSDPFKASLPMMLPHLAPGEQGALWDDTLTGTITGLTLAHSGDDLMRALMNGIVVESARCMAVFTSAFGPIRTIRAGGPGLSVQMAHDIADAARTPVAVLKTCSTYSGYGAAQLAARVIDSVEIPSVAIDFTIEPDSARHEQWTALARRHDDLRYRLSGRH